MSRVQFVETVTLPLGTGGGLLPVPNVVAIPYIVNPDGSTGAQANAFADRITETPDSTLETDATGTVSFYLDEGDYDVHFEDTVVPPRLQPFVRSFRSNPVIVDTGWVGLVLNTGWTALAASYTPSARLLGDFLYLRGGVTNSSGSTKGAGSTLATLPAALFPAKNVNVRITTDNSGGTYLTVSASSGQINIAASVLAATSVFLDGVIGSAG